jgi:excinuclease ABC subunit A
VCQGFGRTIGYDMDLVVPDPTLSIAEGAIEPWNRPHYEWVLEDFAARHKRDVRLRVPYSELTPAEKEIVRKEVEQFFHEVERKKYKVHVRVFLSRYRGYATCHACGGARLREEALHVRVGGKSIAEAVRMNIGEARRFFDNLELGPEQAAIAARVLGEIRQRLRFLENVGLDYLTLDRLTMTLSGGEAQRIQLATCLGSRLVGTIYVLDEPSIGLHPRDTARLIRILEELRDLGNTVLVVEHDADVMRAADHIVDLGPGAGELGGSVVFEGTLAQMLNGAGGRRVETLTARYLRGEARTSWKTTRKQPDPARTLRFFGCRAHNLKDIDVEIPLGLMTVVTGVSGSGKSTLVHDVVYRNLMARYQRDLAAPQEDAELDSSLGRQTCRRVEGAALVRGLVLVDQSPIGRTPRSNPVTYTKAFDPIRELFASTPEAVRRGYTAGHFSFNVSGGRCETCEGGGTVTVEMQFLADVELVCEDCRGMRYKPQILEVRYKGLNIHEVLQLTVREAISFFSGHAKIVSRLQPLADVGLGYLRLGQSATTLSGGEAQRVKLASHLSQSDVAGHLFLFDEPTTGLHFDDITKLLDAMDRLLLRGASVLIIEHNLEVIRHADWVIDLGPEGGQQGGRVVVAGPPEAVAACEHSYTGRFLRPLLAQGKA